MDHEPLTADQELRLRAVQLALKAVECGAIPVGAPELMAAAKSIYEFAADKASS